MTKARTLNRLFCVRLIAFLGLAVCVLPAFADQSKRDSAAIDNAAMAPKVLAWRRDFHQHPELGNNEVRTAAIVAKHLQSLGMVVRTGIAHTGVSGILKGARPGPRIVLRADMDALPVKEENDLAFASKVTSSYRGQPVGVMHACGHDAHVAILMAVAEILSAKRAGLAGEVMFVFQPAEEGPPEVGQPFGAALMLEEGVFKDFKPDAVFGLHVWAALPVGKVGYRSGPTMAAADEWTLRINGRQSHGSRPWDSVDPIMVAAQIQIAAQSIIARQIDIVRSPVVLTTGAIMGGVRYNIIPDHVDMTGTLRTFDPAVRLDVIKRFERIAQSIAQASDASAELRVSITAPLTANDAKLTEQGGASLRRVLGDADVVEMPLLTIAEDFSQYSTVAPTFFYFVGSTSPEIDASKAPSNHSPLFMLDERALMIAVNTLTQVSLDALKAGVSENKK